MTVLKNQRVLYMLGSNDRFGINTAWLPQGSYRLTVVLAKHRQHTLTVVKQ